MRQDGDLLLDNQLCFALYSSSLVMSKTYQPLLKKLGVTYPQYLVLLVLWQSDKLTVSSLGQLLYLDSGTLTSLLKRLEKAGLLHRERSLEDERQVIISLTLQGKNLKKKAVGIPKDILCALGSSSEEVRKMINVLKIYRANLLRNI